MDDVSRREFAGMLMGALALLAAKADGQATGTGGTAPLTVLSSGVFRPQAGKATQPGHVSRQFLAGMLTAGNIRMEMHETVQQPGAPHEAVDAHKHNEIWLVQRGTATLYLNGVEHTMEAGDIGLCCAGDKHWIANKGNTELAYFVVEMGPPE